MSRVSVIIPCFNQGHFVREAVDSVLRQTWQDFEIVVVNDGSTEEESRRILNTLSLPSTIVVHTDNQGLAAARNNGIRHSSGEYILPLDADDRIGPRYLEEAVAALDRDPVLGIVYCRAELFGAVEGPWQLPEYSLEEMLLDNCIFCSAMFRRSDWALVGGYDEGLVHGWEDYDFWLSLIERGRRVHCLPNTHFYYRVSEDSMVRARPREHKTESFVRIFYRHEALFREHIGVWIGLLLDARGGYHEAWLSGEGIERGALGGRLVRKIERGLHQLRFSLAGLDEIREFRFHPADDWALFHVLQARVEDGTAAMAVVVPPPLCCSELAGHILGRGADSCLVLALPPGRGSGDMLVLEVNYLALGRDCLTFLEAGPEQAGTREFQDGQERACPVPLPSLPDRASERRGGLAMLKSLVRSVRNVLRDVWRHLGGLWFNSTDSSFRAVFRSGLFDSGFYLRANPTAHSCWNHPLAYYIRRGFRENINPQPLFDIAWYRTEHPEVGDGDPLLHYIERGCRDGARPTALFFTSWYAAQYPESTAPGWTPLRHYSERGWRSGCRPNPLFDSAYYLACHPEVEQQGRNPLEHYIAVGSRQSWQPNPLFDTVWYQEDNPTLAPDYDKLLHYIRFGAAEGRSPHRLFDPEWYRVHQNIADPDPLAPYAHFVTQGSRQGARPWRLFDPVYYAGENPAAAAGPLNHYLAIGVHEGKYPCGEVASLERKPLISVITPVYDTDPLLLRKCIQSVLYQAYPHWELCLVDDASPSPQVRPVLEEFAAMDRRIRVHVLAENLGIAGASNAALAMATGEYVAMLDHDDELSLDALYELARAINLHDPDMLYSDEELVDLGGRFLESFAKPDWNPELLLCHNYITHLLTVRRQLVQDVGGFAAETSGAQDYDLTLKLSEVAGSIHHVAQSLYRWRASETSTSIHHSQKDYADTAGRQALTAAVTRRRLLAVVEPGVWKFYYRLRRHTTPPTAITIITRVAAADPMARLRQISQLSPGGNVRLVALLPPDLPTELLQEVAAADERLMLLSDPAPECPGQALSEAGLAVRDGLLVFLGAEVLPVSSDWLEALGEYAGEPKIGVVGGRIDGTPSGVRSLSAVPDLRDGSPRYWAEFFREASRHLNGIVCPQNVLALSADLCMVRAETFQRMQGFAAGEYPCLLFDADLCLRLREDGFANVYTPYCRAERLTGTSLVSPECSAVGAEELVRFRDRWQDLLLSGDPWYNPGGLLRQGICTENAWLAWRLGRDTMTAPSPDTIP